MPALPNQRQERFAQELAKGCSKVDAYGLAGYIKSTTAAWKLSQDPAVQARVRELLERAAVRAEISIASVTTSLAEIARKGEEQGEPAGLSVARAAWMDVAKINGLIVDKSEAKVSISHEDALEALR